MTNNQEKEQEQRPGNRKVIVLAIVLLIYELLVCFLYGFLFGYNSTLFINGFDVGGILLTSIMALLMVVGFGLINAYVTRSSATGISFSLFIFAITVQNFFLMRAFWNKAGTNDVSSLNTFSENNYSTIGFSNYLDDRQSNSNLPTASFTDAVACSISLLVAVSPVIGRIGIFEVFFLTLFGPFFYEVNSQLLHRFYITDTGYGMRILIFGSFLGLITTCILGKKQTTQNHAFYKSQYASRALSLIGFVIIFCAYPMLCAAGLLTYTAQDKYILYAAPVNMWLALSSGVLGSFTASTFTYRKFSVHDLIFSGLSGGFVFSSSSDINFNPTVPLIMGYLFGFLTSLYCSRFMKNSNEAGVLYTYSHLQRFLIPGIVSCILSAILHGLGDWTNGSYGNYIQDGRSTVGQGAFQLVGLALSAGIGILAGAIIGGLYRLVNNHETEDQFNDNAVYVPITTKTD